MLFLLDIVVVLVVVVLRRRRGPRPRRRVDRRSSSTSDDEEADLPQKRIRHSSSENIGRLWRPHLAPFSFKKMRSIVAFSSRSRLMRQVCVSSQQFRQVTVSKSILDTIPQSAITDCTQTKLKEAVSINPRRLVVLDDDPTGCHTVYDVNVLLDYSVESIQSQLEKDDRLFYILTNTRSLPESEAVTVTKTVIKNVNTAVERCSYPHPIQYISRSDSTLRGHYPAEVNAIADALASVATYDGTIIMPAFFEGGRLTFEDIHYVEENGVLTPAGETPFAKDAHFSFRSSNLRDWVAEKANIDRKNVASISLRDIRQGGPMEVADKLEHVPQGTAVVVNCKSVWCTFIFLFALSSRLALGTNAMKHLIKVVCRML